MNSYSKGNKTQRLNKRHSMLAKSFNFRAGKQPKFELKQQLQDVTIPLQSVTLNELQMVGNWELRID